jgi:hypothetical protein
MPPLTHQSLQLLGKLLPLNSLPALIPVIVLVGVAALIWKPALATLSFGNRLSCQNIQEQGLLVRLFDLFSVTASDITARARKAKRNADCFYFN